MDRQASTTKSDLERMFFDESIEVKPLPLSLLNCITNDFSHNNEIGRGGFAVVYKGLLENRAVAVKKLSQHVDIDEKKFIGEVRCLMKVNHKNIVRFLGYCSDTQGQWVESVTGMADVRQRLLCFEYLPNGTLDKYIKDSSREWRKCYQIIKGVCEGLHYLHKERIVHQDLKPANILLDNDMVPKITDFGLSRCFDEKQTHAFTSNLIGTVGYVAPEFHDGKISYKSDVYSLGVIIIEILTAQKGYPVIEDVLECWRHKVEKSLEEQQLEQIRVCTKVGQSCLETDPAKRPCVQGIIDILEQTESKERRIDTGAKASSLVENKNKSTRRSLTPEASKRRGTIDAKTIDRTCKAVTQAMCEFYNQGRVDMSYDEVYRGSYNMVMHKKGEDLYSVMETTMTSEVQKLCRPLDASQADGVLFLQELLAKWNRHIRAVNFTCELLRYMDRKFVPTNHKTPIYELGLRLWRHHLVCSDKIRPRLVDAVKKQRGGEDKLVVAGVKKMLTELGEDVPGLFFPDGELQDVAGP